MKLNAMMAVTGLTLCALIASAPSFARTKAEIDASADKAIARFYAINPKNKELADVLVQVHGLLAWTLFCVVLLHVAAALKHHFFDRDATLKRMLAWHRP